MIVHLVASIHEPEADAEYLRQITEAIYAKGAVLADNWVEAALQRNKHDISVTDWTPYVEANIDAVKHADVIITDISHYAFSQGFLVAAALRYKKPILAISRHDTTGHTAQNITDPLFTYKKYTSNESLKKIVDTFLTQNTVHTKDLRFNMFLTRQIFKYLEDMSRETGKSRSEIIRALVKRKAEEGQRG